MGLTLEELQKVQNLTHEEAFIRVKKYYTSFMAGWKRMSDQQKADHKFGHGRGSPVDYVNRSEAYLAKLPTRPTVTDSIDLARNVVCQSLEYGYHDADEHGIKMAAYAHYLLNLLNNGKL